VTAVSLHTPAGAATLVFKKKPAIIFIVAIATLLLRVQNCFPCLLEFEYVKPRKLWITGGSGHMPRAQELYLLLTMIRANRNSGAPRRSAVSEGMVATIAG
jgi:hypothetical protein